MSTMPTPDSPPDNGSNVASILRLATGYLWIAAGVFTVVFPPTLAMSGVRVDEQVLTMLVAAGVVLGLLFGAVGIGLLLRWQRVRWFAVALALLVLAGAAVLGASQLWLPAGLVFVLFAPTLALAHPATARDFDRVADQGDSADGVGVSKSLRYALLVVVGLAAVYVVESESDKVHEWYRLRAATSECEETGEPEACGQAALLGLLRTDSPADAERSFETFQELCAQDRPFACRMLGLIQTRAFIPAARFGGVAIVRQEIERLDDACQAGDPMACLARAATGETQQTSKSIEAARKLCADGEPWGCKAWERLLSKALGSSQHPLAYEASLLSCDAGFRSGCETVGSVADGDRVELCRRGWSESCAILAAKTENDVLRAAYLALAELRTETSNVGHYGLEVPANVDFSAACEDGVSAACFLEGLRVHQGEVDVWRPPPPDIDRLDATFGRACSLGHDTACIAYAVRLLNRPLDEPRDIERANRLLQTSCDRGWARACWMRNHESDLLAMEYDRLRDSARRACREVPEEKQSDNACDVYGQILSHDLGATPWVIADRVGFARLRKTCADYSDYFACTQAAFLSNRARTTPLLGPMTPMWTVTWDAASRACAQGYTPGCNELLTATLSPGHEIPQSFREVEREVCEKLPEVCDELYK